MSIKIAPSILAADFGNLNKDCALVNQSEADWFHIDIMDGVFVPNISFGMPVLKAIQNQAKKPLDVHLMIIEPERYIDTFAALGAYILTVHYEACKHLHSTIQKIKSAGMLAGVALNPHTPVTLLESIIQDLDLVCLMSVNPGFGGQAFILKTYDKIAQLSELIHTQKSNCLIEIDGGVSSHNAQKLTTQGADVLVAGSAVFGSPNPLKTIADLKSLSI